MVGGASGGGGRVSFTKPSRTSMKLAAEALKWQPVALTARLRVSVRTFLSEVSVRFEPTAAQEGSHYRRRIFERKWGRGMGEQRQQVSGSDNCEIRNGEGQQMICIFHLFTSIKIDLRISSVRSSRSSEPFRLGSETHLGSLGEG